MKKARRKMSEQMAMKGRTGKPGRASGLKAPMQSPVGVVLLLLLAPLLFMSTLAYDYETALNETELPFNDTEEFLISSSQNITVQADYGEFLSGPSSLALSAGEPYTLQVYVGVPSGTWPGNYTSTITLSNGNFFTFSFEVLEVPVEFSVETDKSVYRLEETAYITLRGPAGTLANLSIETGGSVRNFSTNIDKSSAFAYLVEEEGSHVLTGSFAYKNITGNASAEFFAYEPLSCSIRFPGEVIQGTEASLGARVQGGLAPYSYFWTIGGTESSQERPTLSFPDASEVDARLVVEDRNGWSASCEGTIRVTVNSPALTVEVTENSTGKGVGDAEVLVNGTKRKTNLYGRAVFDSLPVGVYEIEIARQGYSPGKSVHNHTDAGTAKVSIIRKGLDPALLPQINVLNSDEIDGSSPRAPVTFDLVSGSKVRYCFLLAKEAGYSGYRLMDSAEDIGPSGAYSLDMDFEYNGRYIWLVECRNQEGSSRTKEYPVEFTGLKDRHIVPGAGTGSGEDLAGKDSGSPREASVLPAADSVAAGASHKESLTSEYDALLLTVDESISGLERVRRTDPGLAPLISIMEYDGKLQEAKSAIAGVRKTALDMAGLDISQKDVRARNIEMKGEILRAQKEVPVKLETLKKGSFGPEAATDSAVKEAAEEYLQKSSKELGGWEKRRFVSRSSEVSGMVEVTTRYRHARVTFADSSVSRYTLITHELLLKENHTGLMYIVTIPKSVAGSVYAIEFEPDYEVINEDPVVRFFMDTSARQSFSYAVAGHVRPEDIEGIGSAVLIDIAYPENSLTGFFSLSGGLGGDRILFPLVFLMVGGSLGYIFLYRNEGLKRAATENARKAIEGSRAAVRAVRPRSRKAALFELIGKAIDLIKSGLAEEALKLYPQIFSMHSRVGPEVREGLRPVMIYLKNEMDLYCIEKEIDSAFECLGAGNESGGAAEYGGGQAGEPLGGPVRHYDGAEELFYSLPDEYRNRVEGRMTNLRLSMELMAKRARQEAGRKIQEDNVDDRIFGAAPQKKPTDAGQPVGAFRGIKGLEGDLTR